MRQRTLENIPRGDRHDRLGAKEDKKVLNSFISTLDGHGGHPFLWPALNTRGADNELDAPSSSISRPRDPRPGGLRPRDPRPNSPRPKDLRPEGGRNPGGRESERQESRKRATHEAGVPRLDTGQQ